MALLIRITLISVLVVAAIGCTPELKDKAIFPDLQAIEYTHRHDKPDVPILLKSVVGAEKYDALGVPSSNAKFPFVWIVLNANDGEGDVLQMPGDQDAKISCDYLDDLNKSEMIDSVVEAYLKKNCTKGKPLEHPL